MQIKKAGGKVYGAVLNAAEKKAMDMEIRRQLAEYERKHGLETDAMILWVLHEKFGFGEKRLKRFYDGFAAAVEELVKAYEATDGEYTRLCSYKLKKYGIDIERWHNERE